MKYQVANSTVSTFQERKRNFIRSLWPGFIPAIIMFTIKAMEVAGDFSLSMYGLKPRIPTRLYGIVTFPFLHADWLHLFSNLIPFLFLSTLITNLFPRFFWKIFLLTFFLSGFWTWCFARNGTVIGASGWVYALLGFLLMAGFSRSSRNTMIIAGGLAFLYGGMVEGLVPFRSGVSWEGHLMGLLSGIIGAIYWRKEIKSAEIPGIPTKSKPFQDIDYEPPYPYWLSNEAPFMGPDRRIIPPEDIIWENGKPRIKTLEEKQAVQEGEPKAENPFPGKTSPPSSTFHHTGNTFTGYWQINQS